MSNHTKTGVCVARFVLFLLSRIFHLLFGGLLRVVRGVHSVYPASFLFLSSLLFPSVFLTFLFFSLSFSSFSPFLAYVMPEGICS